MKRPAGSPSKPQPPRAPPRRPGPWRTAELEEQLHTLENQRREQALRDDPPVPPPPAAEDTPTA